LVIGHRQVRADEPQRPDASTVDDELFAHPVHRRGPVEPADGVAAAAHERHVFGWGDGPAAVVLQFGETTGIQRPRPTRDWQGAPAGEAGAGDEQRHVELFEPVRRVGAEVEP
jgi:hypothetical protein